MTRRVVVLGAGGHARVLLDALRLLGDDVVGCIDPDPAAGLPGVPRLGGDEAFATLDPAGVLLVNGLGSIASTALRRRVHADATARGFAFATVVHPSAVVARDVVLAAGAQVCAGAVLQTGARVLDDALVNTRASVDHDSVVGAHAHVAPGAVVCGGVTIGDGAHVGTGAVLVQGVRIGADALVGAGAVVLRDVAAGRRVVGVPARESGG